MELLACVESNGQQISVYAANELYGEIGKFRYLQFGDNAVQGAIDLRNPGRIVLEYQQAMIGIMEAMDPQFAAAYIIGHGVGTIAGRYPAGRCKVAEIDSHVVALSREWFGYAHGNVYVGDGRELLGCEANGSQSFIVVDAFTSSGVPVHLATCEFFALASDRLRPEGAFIMNVMGRAHHDPWLAAVSTTLMQVFPHVHAFTLPLEPGARVRNLILAASHAPLPALPAQLDRLQTEAPSSGHLLSDR